MSQIPRTIMHVAAVVDVDEVTGWPVTLEETYTGTGPMVWMGTYSQRHTLGDRLIDIGYHISEGGDWREHLAWNLALAALLTTAGARGYNLGLAVAEAEAKRASKCYVCGETVVSPLHTRCEQHA